MRKQAFKKIQELIHGFRERYSIDLTELSQTSKKMLDACSRVERSFSGSFAGYHGRLYYRDFETPPLEERFSVEWGTIHGIPDGWDERGPEDVKYEIERLMGENFSIDELEKFIQKLFERVKKLHTEIIVFFSSFQFGNAIKKEKELFLKIEDFKFGGRKEEFISRHLPKKMITRDSEALMQGMCVPSHLYYMGVAYESKSICDAIEEFLELSDRLLRQVQAKGIAIEQIGNKKDIHNLKNLHPHIYSKCRELYEKGAYAEAVEKSFKVVRDKLRKLTGYETGAEAFGKGKLYVKGASAPNVEEDFNNAVKFLTMAIDRFRNEKSHTSDAKIDDSVRAYEYLRLSSLAMNLLEDTKIISQKSIKLSK